MAPDRGPRSAQACAGPALHWRFVPQIARKALAMLVLALLGAAGATGEPGAAGESGLQLEGWPLRAQLREWPAPDGECEGLGAALCGQGQCRCMGVLIHNDAPDACSTYTITVSMQLLPDEAASSHEQVRAGGCGEGASGWELPFCLGCRGSRLSSNETAKRSAVQVYFVLLALCCMRLHR